jgi:hypothetical protein
MYYERGGCVLITQPQAIQQARGVCGGGEGEGEWEVVEQQTRDLGNPRSSFSSSSSSLCIRWGFDKNSTLGSAVHSPDRASARSTARPTASSSCYSLHSTSSLSLRMQRALKLVHIRVNRSCGSSCTGTGIHSGLSLPMIMSTGPAA